MPRRIQPRFVSVSLLWTGLIFILIGISAARANLIVNGSFEQTLDKKGNPITPVTTNGYAAIPDGTGATGSLYGWTSTAGNGTGPANYIATVNSGATWIPNATVGSYCVQLDSTQNTSPFTIGGSVSQSVSLTAGILYAITFDMSAEVNRNVSTTTQLDLTLNGGGFSNTTTSYTATNVANATQSTTNWVNYEYMFTPTVSGPITFTFQDVFVSNSISSNSSLDNVNLTVVPEISHWSVMIGVVLAAAGFHYHRERRNVRRS